MQINPGVMKLIRRALILLAGSALCALAAIVLFTNVGIQALFRLGVRMSAEEVDVGDTAYLEYYEMKKYMGGVDSYRIYLDGSINGSYDAALDVLKFIKQNEDINLVCLDGANAEAINEYLASGDRTLLTGSGVSSSCDSFLMSLYTYNQLLPPQKRVTIVGTTEPAEGRFIIVNRAYDRSERVEGIMDVSIIYPGTSGCDPLFDVPSIHVDSRRIRFGETGQLDAYIGMLDAVSGNLGMQAFDGINQPEFYFIIENGAEDADA